MRTVDDIVDALGGTFKVAAALKLNPSVVSSWRKRASIPADRWLDLVDVARSIGASGITVEVLALLHARRGAARVEVRA